MTPILTLFQQPMPAKAAPPLMPPEITPGDEAPGQGFLACLRMSAEGRSHATEKVAASPGSDNDPAGLGDEAICDDLVPADLPATPMGPAPDQTGIAFSGLQPMANAGAMAGDTFQAVTDPAAGGKQGEVPAVIGTENFDAPLPESSPAASLPLTADGDKAANARLTGDVFVSGSMAVATAGAENRTPSAHGAPVVETAPPGAASQALAAAADSGKALPATEQSPEIPAGESAVLSGEDDTRGPKTSQSPSLQALDKTGPAAQTPDDSLQDPIRAGARDPENQNAGTDQRRPSQRSVADQKTNPALETMDNGLDEADADSLFSTDSGNAKRVSQTKIVARGNHFGQNREDATAGAGAAVQTDAMDSADLDPDVPSTRAAEKPGEAGEARRNSASVPRSVQTGVVNQLADKAVLLSRNGRPEMHIDLKPGYLGRIQMKVSTENQRVTVQMMAETPMAREIVEASLGQLRADLAAQGLQIDSFEVDLFASADPGHDGAGTMNHGQGRRKGAVHKDSDPGARELRPAAPDAALPGNGDGAIDYFA